MNQAEWEEFWTSPDFQGADSLPGPVKIEGVTHYTGTSPRERYDAFQARRQASLEIVTPDQAEAAYQERAEASFASRVAQVNEYIKANYIPGTTCKVPFDAPESVVERLSKRLEDRGWLVWYSKPTKQLEVTRK